MDKRTLVYSCLSLGRILVALNPQTGYIHPDEFFQSPEPMAGDVFDFSVLVPWEFSNDGKPLRSIVFPFLSSQLPFRVLKWINSIYPGTITQYTLLVAPRLMMCLLSFFLDLCAYRLSLLCHTDPFPSVVVLSTSLAVWVHACRPFSNSLEAVLVGLVALLLLNPGSPVRQPAPKTSTKKTSTTAPTSRSSTPSTTATTATTTAAAATATPPTLTQYERHWWLDTTAGTLIAIGVYTRFTFVLFLIPFVAVWIYNEAQKPIRAGRSIWLGAVRGILYAGAWLFPAFLRLAVLLTLADSFYFGVLTVRWRTPDEPEGSPINITGRVTCTPYNALMYNLDSENLKTHGLHPRITHLLVNMPMLFGPMALLFFHTLYQLLSPLVSVFDYEAARRHIHDMSVSLWPPAPNPSPSHGRRIMLIALVSAIVLPLVLLSIQPHQEARFLLPLVVPLAVVFGPKIYASAPIMACWLLFNIAVGGFYGAMHQGGVTPALSDISVAIHTPSKGSACSSTHVVFYRTYMPPRYLLASPRTSDEVHVHDLAGSNSTHLAQTTQSTAVTVTRPECPPPGPDTWCPQLFLALPSTRSDDITSVTSHLGPPTATTTYPWHFSGENPPSSIGDLGLHVYRWTMCN